MVFGNEMCQTLTKQPENDGIEAIYRGLPFLISENFHLSKAEFFLL
jgi:hypothetical protein